MKWLERSVSALFHRKAWPPVESERGKGTPGEADLSRLEIVEVTLFDRDRRESSAAPPVPVPAPSSQAPRLADDAEDVYIQVMQARERRYDELQARAFRRVAPGTLVRRLKIGSTKTGPAALSG